MTRPLTVLVVDEDSAATEALVRSLRRQGYRVTMAHDAASALKEGGRFDVAVVDLALPDLHGDDLAQRLRERGAVGTVIFFTSESDAAVRKRAQAHGEVVEKKDIRRLRALLRSMA